jgi:quinol monooxygenase YgiN
MRGLFLIGAAMLAMTGLPAAAAEVAAPGAVYRICYFEAAAPETAAVARLVGAFAAASHRQAGNLGFAALEEIGRPSRFAFFEAWHDEGAAAAHDSAASTAAFNDKIARMLVGPFEIRTFSGFSLAPARAEGNAHAVYVLTHIDVFPPSKDLAAALVTALAAAGRKMPGNLRFDVLQMAVHTNHFALVEGWRDRHAFDASLTAAPTKQFRQKLTPLEGGLFDERLYRALR